ncbi:MULTISPECIES: DUF2946 family protein [Burkholderia]|uniref:DUF2946 domain-containing protein n=1 Tax=Burkholderia anthina TaxID=179879 RepID=A0A7T6VMW7_9BURK|nr:MULTISPECIES: DUF2946 family protein [Burkholderia]MBY4869671.1 hypothetical protein [Burkholderia anthina]QQK06860.1 hypothetical protein JFN94_18790 [Burkholderia anthina]
MIRLRQLLAQRLTHPAVASLLLLVVAFRLLLPPGLMLSPSTSANIGDLVICSGHGALLDDTVAISAAPAATVAASDLANALGSAESHADHSHSGDICPFSATLAISVAVTVLVTAYWLQSITSTRVPRPANDACPAVTATFGPFGARAPPFTALS